MTDLTSTDDNCTQTDISRRGIVVYFKGAKRLLEHNNVVGLELPTAHHR